LIGGESSLASPTELAPESSNQGSSFAIPVDKLN